MSLRTWFARLSPEDASKLEKLGSTMQNVVVSFAVLVGGIWAYYQFRTTLQPRLAAAQLAGLSREAINITITATGSHSFPVPSEPGYVQSKSDSLAHSRERDIFVTVQVANEGVCEASLSLHRNWQTMYVSLVRYVGSQVSPQKGDEYYPASWAILRSPDIHQQLDILRVPARSTRSIPYYLQVRGPGLYFLRFQSPDSLSAPCGPSGDGIRPLGDPPVPITDSVPILRDYINGSKMWLASTYLTVQ